MAYRIRAGESVEDAIRRIAREQVDKAIDEIGDDDLDRHETVHQVRKRCKKIRGLVRLVRPQLDDTYERENAWYRDPARSLSRVRDVQSDVESLAALVGQFEAAIDRNALVPVRAALVARRETLAADEADLPERLDAFLSRMREGRERIAAWRVPARGFDAVGGGLTRTYARCRTAMASARETPDTERFHEWRKRCKYHWYHMRLLRLAWPGPIGARRDEADRLSDLLGDDHDLALLRATLADLPDASVPGETVRALLALARQRQVELRASARTTGACLYAEKPKRFATRIRAYWEAQQA